MDPVNRFCVVCNSGVTEGEVVCERQRCSEEWATRKCRYCGIGILQDAMVRYPGYSWYPALLELFRRSVCFQHANATG